MRNPELLTNTKRKVERLTDDKWMKVALADINKGDTFRLTDAVHMNVYKAATDPYLDGDVWSVFVE